MSQHDIWGALDKEYKLFPEDFGKAVTNKEILEIMLSLRVTFSKSYRKFLRLYGSAVLPGFIIWGTYPLESMGKSSLTVVDKTKFYKEKQKWPGIEDWYVISDDGSGNPIGCKPDGSVWLSDHDAGFKQIKLANDFEEFIHKLLTDTLYDNVSES